MARGRVMVQVFPGAARRALLAGLIALAVQLPGGAQAERLELDAGNLQQLAVIMINQGRPEQALAMAEALLQRDPADAGALALKSRAERDLGRDREALASGRAAWAAAKTDGQRYDASMAVAQALATGGSKFRAQFWLRRAMEVAPDATAKRMAERDFAYVRNRSRLWLRFDASIKPSNNVNNGSSSEILWFYGFPLTLSPDAQAMSGVEASLAATMKFRVAETELAKTDLRLSAIQSLVFLSGEAKAAAPWARGSDYNYTALEAAVERSWRPAKGMEAYAAGVLGHSWYGGDPMAQYLRLDLGATKIVSAKLSFKGSLSVEKQDRVDSASRSADVVTLGLGVIARTAAKDRIEVAMSFRDTKSDASEIDHDRLRLQLDLDRAKPVLGAKLSLGLWAEARDFDRSRYSTDGRQDTGFGAELSLAFDKVDYMGFIPVMTLSGSTNESNISLYDSQSFGLGFSIRSKF